MIDIPHLNQHRLRHCVVCARIPSTKEDVVLSLRTRTTAGLEFCLVFEHGDDDGEGETYLHVELAAPDYFKDETPPKRTGTKRDFDKAVGRVLGAEVMASVTGTFRVEAADVSPDGFIQLQPRSVNIPGVQSKYRGASIELTGLPVRRIEWRTVESEEDDKEQVEIRIKGRFRLAMSDNYLVEAVDFLKSGLSIAVTGEFDESQA